MSDNGYKDYYKDGFYKDAGGGGGGYIDYYKDGFYKDAGGGGSGYKDYYKDGFYKDASRLVEPLVKPVYPDDPTFRDAIGPLEKALAAAGVPDVDTSNLIEIILEHEYAVPLGAISPQSREWIGKMVERAHNGEWEVDPGVTADSLFSALRSFKGR